MARPLAHRPALRRWLWFVAIWVASVAALGAVAYVIRAAIL